MVVKLIDFGLGRRIPVKNGSTPVSFTSMERVHAGLEDEGLGPDGLMTTPVGTPHFVAPEVLCSLPYSKEVDLFACGVIMFWLLSGILPFEDVNATRLADKIKDARYDFRHPAWNNTSTQAKDLISRLLERSPFERISATAALSHPWFDQAPQTEEIVVEHWTVDPFLKSQQLELRASAERSYHSNTFEDGRSFIPKLLSSRHSSSSPMLMSPVTPSNTSKLVPVQAFEMPQNDNSAKETGR